MATSSSSTRYSRSMKPAPCDSRVVALVYEGLSSFEYACAAEIFATPRPELHRPLYRFETVGAESNRPTPAAHGLSIVPDRDVANLGAPGTVLIPGWKPEPTSAVPDRVIDALLAANSLGSRLVAICTGAFVLAATGLLDGKRATTHWRFADVLQRMYPRIQVVPNVLYIDEGSVLTCAGSAAVIDLCLHVIRKDYGAEVANHIARRLVIAPHRDGRQAQFVERPIQRRENSLLAGLLEQMNRRIAEDFSVPELARMAAMSERTFLRRFKEATGCTPADWLRFARLDRARQLLESSSFSIEAIAQQCGFRTATTLREQFRKRLGVSPSAYKRRFARPGAERLHLSWSSARRSGSY